MPKLEVVNANNVIEFNPQKANFKLKNTGGPKGETGATGPAGAAATIAVGTTTTGAEGTNASVTNSGTSSAAVFDFTIPRGATGATGATGPAGADGADGADGFSPIATVTQEGLDAEISITDKNGTTTATVPGFGVQVVESLPATGSSNIIYLERDSNSASGNPISIADAVEAPLKSVEIQGNTTQQTYTGKNLLNTHGTIDADSLTGSGVSYTINADGTISTSGSNSGAYKSIRFLLTLPAGTYKFSGCPSGGTNNGYSFCVEPRGDSTLQLFDTGNGNEFTLTEQKTIRAYPVRIGADTGVNMNGKVFKPMITVSTAEQTYEPYVGGVPAPNPDYPQAVNTVTGEQTITINSTNYEVNLGKNLAEISDFSVSGTGYSVVASSGLVSVSSTTTNRAISLSSGTDGGSWLPAYNASSVVDHHITSVGGTYILSLANVTKTISGSQALYITIYTNKRAVSNTSLTSSSDFTPTAITLDSDEYIKDIWIWLGGSTTYTATFNVQLEEGSTATSYSAYFTPIELCKIGTYQDYIYKSGDKWYVHKEIGKETLNSTSHSGWQLTTSSDGYIRGDTVGEIGFPSNAGYCDKLVVRTGAHGSYEYIWFQPTTIGKIYIQILASRVTALTLAAFNTWIDSATPTIYYALATPTDTTITNTALIAQLEAILAGGTQAGANTITLTPSAGATGTLEVEYYDSYDSYLWVNNRWEKFAHLG